MDIEEINRELRAILKPHRYEHSQGVRYTAAALAMKYHGDIKKSGDSRPRTRLCQEHER